MKKLLFCCIAILSLHAEIIEIQSIDQMTPHLTKDTLVIFDIDHTIYRAKQYMGSDVWFGHRWKLHGLEKALSEWMSVMNLTEVVPVEEGVSNYIADLQQKGYPLIGLTTRGLAMAHCTKRQLNDLGIDLSITAPTKKQFSFFQEEVILFRQGTLFTAGTDKGECLKKLLERCDLKPQRIVFINDKASHIKPVESFCKKAGIPFVGLRYGKVDEWVAKFAAQKADKQFEQFKAVIASQVD